MCPVGQRKTRDAPNNEPNEANPVPEEDKSQKEVKKEDNPKTDEKPEEQAPVEAKTEEDNKFNVRGVSVSHHYL